MVAITAILAAVIGTFVLGLGDSLEQAPQSNLDVSSDEANTITISHSGGDALQESDIAINVEGENNNTEFDVGTGEFGVGDELSNQNNDIYSGTMTVAVIHNASDSVVMEQDVEIQSD